jgi:biopolymer transport protein ExbD
MKKAHYKPDFAPIIHINGLPILLGIILVISLLLLAVPTKRYDVVFDFPTCIGMGDTIDHYPNFNRIDVSETGEILWNGQKSNLTQIHQYLLQTKTMSPEPELQFKADPNAGYDAVMKTVTMIKDSDVRLLGWIGNESYGSFGKAKRNLD